MRGLIARALVLVALAVAGASPVYAAADQPQQGPAAGAGADEAALREIRAAIDDLSKQIAKVQAQLHADISNANADVKDDLRGQLARLTTVLGQLQKQLNVPRGGGDDGGAPQWPYWVLAFAAMAALSLVSLRAGTWYGRRAMAGGPSERDAGGNYSEALMRTFRDQSLAFNNATRRLGEISAGLQDLRSEIWRAAASRSEPPRPDPATAQRTAAPQSAPAREPARPPQAAEERPDRDRGRGQPQPDARVEIDRLLREFNAMADDDSKARTFVEHWRPQSVVMTNFDQRVRESAYAPDLRVRDGQIGAADDHFWFIPLQTQWSGYLLPARSWLLHRSALRGEGAKLFRSIFDVEPRDSFTLQRPAHADLEGDRVQVRTAGLVGLPQ
jgi:hypothetical protein